IEIIRLGPALEQNRFERFLFYPDRKSTGRKQVQAILAKQDESATTAESLKGKSVAVQGLGALELVLYGNGAEILSSGSGGFRCRYGLAVSQNLRKIAGEFLAEWEKPDGIQAAWKKPGTSNPLFRDNKEAATELLGVLVHSVEMVKEQRLFDTAGMEELLPADSRSIAGSIDFLFKALIAAADRMEGPVDAALADERQRATLDFIALNTADLLDRLNRQFGASIGLGAGFSFADGD
ncbi:hypothetical protein BMJ22_24340, partial [Sinorhizobium medicae]